MRFEELDYQQTPFGELVLRVREPASMPGTDVYEVTLNRAFLMSSLVNDSERALANLALETLGPRRADVLVGGLGLGCTAVAALEHPNVRRLCVVEYLQPIIDWHRERLVPDADRLMSDPRCELIRGDFFEHVGDTPARPQDLYDVILLDIDHSPESLLHAGHGRFYSSEGLTRLARHLRPGGVFALWSADPPPASLLDQLGRVFPDVRSHPVSFHHPLMHEQDEDTIIVAQSAPPRGAGHGGDASEAGGPG